MALTSTLDADFGKFVVECNKAVDALESWQGEAVKTEAALSTMGDKGAESAKKAGDAASEGGKKAAGSASGFGQLSDGMRTADKTLNAFGVSMSKEIGMLDELNDLSGKTATQVGKLGTAFAVAGAAMAGWNIGRKIAELTGSDEIIGNFTAKLLGWGSAADEVKQNNDELIARAQKLGFVGTDVAKAAEFMTNAARANAEQYNTAANRAAAWEDALAKLGPRQADLRREMESGNSTTAQMAQHFKIGADAIDYLGRKMAKETETAREQKAEADKLRAALDEVTMARQGSAQILADLGAETVRAIEYDLKAGVSQQSLAEVYGLSATQIRAVAEAQKANAKAAEDSATATAAARKVVADATKEYYEASAAQSATATQKEILDIGTWRAERMAALAATKGATIEQYEEIDRVAQAKLANVGVNWQALRDGSIAKLADQAETAKRTYDAMLADSNRYTPQAIANAKKLADEYAAQFARATNAGNAMYDAWLAKEAAFSAAVAKHDTERAAAAGKAVDDQAAALDQAIAYAQAYGVSLEEAQAALGQATADAGSLTATTQQGTAAANQMAVAFQQVAGAVGMTAAESIKAGEALEDAYRKAGIFVGMQIATGGYQQQRRLAAGNEILGQGVAWGTGGGATQNTTNLNVNVNSGAAGDIASALVTEMRHSGVRF